MIPRIPRLIRRNRDQALDSASSRQFDEALAAAVLAPSAAGAADANSLLSQTKRFGLSGLLALLRRSKAGFLPRDRLPARLAPDEDIGKSGMADGIRTR